MNDYEIEEANTPEEMRAEIYRLRRYDNLVRSAMDQADYRGLSSEDRYTILSYLAIKRAKKLEDLTLEFYRNNPKPVFIPINKKALESFPTKA